MKKSEFVTMVSEQSGMTKKETEHLIDTTFRCLGDVLAQGDRLSVSGFGIFETRERSARGGRIPSTGERICIPAATIPIFKPAKQLKEKMTKQ